MTNKKGAPETTMVRIKKAVKNKVAKRIVGTGISIGEYFEGAAIDRLKQSSKNK